MKVAPVGVETKAILVAVPVQIAAGVTAFTVGAGLTVCVIVLAAPVQPANVAVTEYTAVPDAAPIVVNV